ncbi:MULTISPECIES: nuclease [unclassified Streptomyces]|uniref:nuclease n=1 Tax=unclassified Streptomyces TaxID=2593676 RepID=UPI002DD7EF2C|nr:nuclease [Streptomyces sp. NBC_01294]WRZ55205.1 nuclease [Streptomyces sp. NBC_01294]WRZ61500.1 nuclease [Streptomyces sp. NBC_01294]
MSMLLIRGSFRVNGGAKPDGDTIPFIPDDVEDWKLVPGRSQIVPKADGRASVRLEGIDALETHYSNGSYGPVRHQPLKFAHRAADAMLTWLGFTSIDRHPDECVTTMPDSVPGFLLTRGADAYGRCVALVGRRTPPAYGGYEIDVDEEMLKRTVNHHLVSIGLAYPAFYTGLPAHLREVLKAAALAARGATPPKGLWSDDVTVKGAKIEDISSITDADGVVILPKLFRRLKDYLDSAPANASLDCFPAFLAGAADTFRILPDGELITGLHKVVEITNSRTLRMTHPAEDILFDEK